MNVELFNVIVPVLVCIGIGYVWVRLNIEFPTDFVSRIVINVGAPCLVFNGLTSVDSSADQFVQMVFAALLLMGSTLFVNVLAVKASGRPLLPLAHSLTFSNWGNLSLPLSLFAFGQEGLALSLGFFVVASVVQNSIGMMFLSGTFSPRALIRLPIIHAVLAALIFMFLDLDPPKWLTDTTGLLGNVLIPLMLLSLGVSLASLRVTRLWKAAGLVIYRLVLGITLGFGVVWLMGLEGVARNVVILTSAMPLAILNYLYASRFGKTPDQVAGIVFLSTILSLVTLPLVLAYLM